MVKMHTFNEQFEKGTHPHTFPPQSRYKTFPFYQKVFSLPLDVNPFNPTCQLLFSLTIDPISFSIDWFYLYEYNHVLFVYGFFCSASCFLQVTIINIYSFTCCFFSFNAGDGFISDCKDFPLFILWLHRIPFHTYAIIYVVLAHSGCFQSFVINNAAIVSNLERALFLM